MSFRQKINGPMCFVEFEDVPFAAQAIKDLYGNNLVRVESDHTDSRAVSSRAAYDCRTLRIPSANAAVRTLLE